MKFYITAGFYFTTTCLCNVSWCKSRHHTLSISVQNYYYTHVYTNRQCCNSDKLYNTKTVIPCSLVYKSCLSIFRYLIYFYIFIISFLFNRIKGLKIILTNISHTVFPHPRQEIHQSMSGWNHFTCFLTGSSVKVLAVLLIFLNLLVYRIAPYELEDFILAMYDQSKKVNPSLFHLLYWIFNKCL